MDPAPLRVVGEQPGDLFGCSVLLTRDATSDLLPDLLVGATGNTDILVGLPEQGAVYLFEASSPTFCKMKGTVTNGALGWALAEAGDVDKSRTADVAFGQPGAGAGTAFLRRVLR